jgi:hypothetical protein
MLRSRRESYHNDGITERDCLQQTSTTKSATSRSDTSDILCLPSTLESFPELRDAPRSSTLLGAVLVQATSSSGCAPRRARVTTLAATARFGRFHHVSYRSRRGVRPNVRDSVAVRCCCEEKPLAHAISAIEAFELRNISQARAIRFSIIRL